VRIRLLSEEYANRPQVVLDVDERRVDREQPFDDRPDVVPLERRLHSLILEIRTSASEVADAVLPFPAEAGFAGREPQRGKRATLTRGSWGKPGFPRRIGEARPEEGLPRSDRSRRSRGSAE
jgi:hypothetical protein